MCVEAVAYALAFSFSWTHNSVVDGRLGAIWMSKERKWSRQKNSMSSRRGRQQVS